MTLARAAGADPPRSASPSLLRVVAASAVVLLVTAYGLRVREGREALARADAAAERAETREVVTALRSAAQARCPACTAPSIAFARLDVVAKEAEARGDLAMARFAHAAARSGALSTMSGVSPERVHAEREIARLARVSDPSGGGPDVAAALADDGLPRASTFGLLTVALILLSLAASRVIAATRPSWTDAALATAGFAVGAVALLAF